jgi:hypothetical protein
VFHSYKLFSSTLGRVAFHPPVHPGFNGALRVLDEFDLPYAEAWRLLRPVAGRLGIPAAELLDGAPDLHRRA